MKAIYLMKKAVRLTAPLTFVFALVWQSATVCIAQTEMKKKPPLRKASIYSSLPGGYKQLGETNIFYKQTSSSIDIIGQFGTSYYSSTYADKGYWTAMQVDDGSAMRVDMLNGSTQNEVNVCVDIEEYAGLAKMKYTVTNYSSSDKTISLGSRADVMIGNNDAAPISKKNYSNGSTYGLNMAHNTSAEAARLVLLFGEGLDGIVAVDDYWFGDYYLNSNEQAVAGNYNKEDGSMYQENGSYDSGLGWCWTYRTIPANSTKEFSILIGVGDVTLLPTLQGVDMELSNPESWNDLSAVHEFDVSGKYFSADGKRGQLFYTVDGGEPVQLTGMLDPEEEIAGTVHASFSGGRNKHVIMLYAQDESGNRSAANTYTYLELTSLSVSGNEDHEFTGSPIEQPGLILFDAESTSALEPYEHFTVSYSDNILPGEASIQIEGIYPYSTGTAVRHFNIQPAQLDGTVELMNNTFVYSGYSFTPAVTYCDNRFGILVQDKDYNVEYRDNVYPGTAFAIVRGIGNYCGTVEEAFFIDKAEMTRSSIRCRMDADQPGSTEVVYDGKSHGVVVSKDAGTGTCTIYYTDNNNQTNTEAPAATGHYSVSVRVEEGDYYKEAVFADIYSFDIYAVDEAEWAVLRDFYLSSCNGGEWTEPWNFEGGIETAGELHGVEYRKGHIVGIDLSHNNLSGAFPYPFPALPYLERLNLEGNNLSGDIGTGMAAYMQMHPGTTITVKEVNINNNLFSGNIGMFASFMPELTTLYAEYNTLTDVYPVLSNEVTEFSASNQIMDRIVSVNLSALDLTSIINDIPTIIFYDHTNRTYSQDCTLVVSDNRSWYAIINHSNGILTFEPTGANIYRGESGELLSVCNEMPYYKFLLKLEFAQGDANFDGDVNIADLQSIINFAFEGESDKQFNFTASDLFRDELINVQDIVCFVNLLFEQDIPANGTKKRSYNADTDNAQACIFWRDGRLILSGTEPVAAMDLVLSDGHAVTWNLEALGMTTAIRHSNGASRLIAYSPDNRVIPAGETVIAEATGDLPAIRNISLVNTDADEITVEVKGNGGIVNGIASATAGMSVDMNGTDIILTSGKELKDVEWSLHAPDGLTVGSGKAAYVPAGATRLSVGASLSSGTYILNISSEGRKVMTKKFTYIK